MAEGIAILLPIYGDRRHIVACIRSLSNQTLAPGEVLAVDDCNDSATSELVRKELARSGLAHRLIRNPTPRGISESTAQALEASSSNLVGFVDCDDLLSPQAVEKVVAAFETEPIDALSSNFSYFRSSPGKAKPRIRPRQETDTQWVDVVGGENFFTHFRVFRRELISDFDWGQAADGVQDAQLNFHLRNHTFKLLDDYLYFHRVHSNQTSVWMPASRGIALNLSRRKMLKKHLPKPRKTFSNEIILSLNSRLVGTGGVGLHSNGRVISSPFSPAFQANDLNLLIIRLNDFTTDESVAITLAQRKRGTVVGWRIDTVEPRVRELLVQFSGLPNFILCVDQISMSITRALVPAETEIFCQQENISS